MFTDSASGSTGDARELKERVGFRLFSRLHEISEFLPLDGVDYRVAGPDATSEPDERIFHDRLQLERPTAKNDGTVNISVTGVNKIVFSVNMLGSWT